ncbi:MAG: hypothetical protein Q4G52_00365, partial [Clostridia bacterium]|nr:hypothetical protein [Clostridia bacterium]
MRKWISVLLCALMVLEPLGALAEVATPSESECAHENKTNVETRRDVAYQEVTAQGHTRVESVYGDVVCADCEKVVEHGVLLEESTTPEEHDLNENRVCTACGYQAPCDHANAAVNNSWTVFKGYDAKDGQTHVEIYERYEQRWCPDCGEYLPETVVGEEEGETYPHYFENGVCGTCGEENTCGHANTYTQEWTDNWSYTPENNATHTVTYDRYLDTWCSDCGERLDCQEIEQGYKDSYSHNYDENGKCYNCGHQNTCDHANTYTQEWADNWSYTPGNNATHTATYDRYQVTLCSDCGKTLDRQLIEEGYKCSESHSYDENGQCYSCGHQNTCDHANATVNSWRSIKEYIVKDEKMHVELYDSYEQKTCPDCNMYFPDEVVAENQEEAFPHYFEGGVCGACGAENGCPHESKDTSEVWDNYTVVSTGDNLTHLLRYDLYVQTRCNDCGEMLVNELIEAGCEQIDNHIYDENSACSLCGHQNACSHANTYQEEWAENWNYTPENNATHVATYDRYQSTFCRDCGERIGHELIESGCTYSEGHSYDESSTCIVCGHQNTCNHVNTHVQEDWENSVVISLGDKTHQSTYDRYNSIWCEDCGERIVRELIELEHTQIDEHNFDDNGQCGSCGHQNTCVHQNTYEQECHGSYIYTPEDNKTHVVTYDRYQETICSDCGQRIARAEIELGYTRVENHTYDENSQCYYCEYQNTCSHANTYQEEWTDNWSYTPENNATHTVTYDRYQDTRCSDCGERLEHQLIEQGYTYSDRHSYDENGKCYGCGHQNTCDHANVVTDSWRVFKEYVAKDEKTHVEIYDLYEQKTCPDCRAYFPAEITAENQEGDAYSHWFENGVCGTCGAANTCPHENTYTSEGWENYTMVSTGDNRTHQETYDRYTGTWCSDCGERLTYTLIEQGHTENTNHYYDENGKCYNCGHQNTCDHANAVVTDSWRVFKEYVAKDEKTHAEIYDLYEQKTCPDCSAYFPAEIVAENQEGNAYSHSFVNGVCGGCGAENTCTHPNLDTWESKGNVTYVSNGSNLTHQIICDLYREAWCSNCSERFERELIEANHTEEQRYSYDENGKCYACDHQNACDHANATMGTVKTCEGYKTKDAKNHAIVYAMYEQLQCPDCSKVFPNGDLIAEREMLEAHQFYNGICTFCGYENACTHENTGTKVVTKKKDAQFEPMDDRYHLVTYDAYEVTVCAVCNAELSEETLVKAGRQERREHSSGTCYACGYKREECQHEHVTESTSWVNAFALDWNAGTHRFIADVMKTTTCLDCGVKTTEIIQENVEGTELHEVNAIANMTGCWCGYEGPNADCKHENTVEESSYQYVSVLAQNETHHKMSALKEIVTSCPVCDEYLGSRYIDDQIVEEEHQWEFGKCVVCGYLNPCPHQTTSEAYAYTRTSILSTNEDTHTMSGDKWKLVICDDCGDTLEKTLEAYDCTFTEEHSYGEDNVCDLCAYVGTVKPT